jgi:small subunit ribosomal protein S16
MLKISLFRTGKKHSSDFRIVVSDKRDSASGGKFLEVLGHYNPRLKESGIDGDRIKYWIEKGAQPSDTVHNLLVREKIINAPKKKVKIPLKKEEELKPEDKKEKEIEAPIEEKVE